MNEEHFEALHEAHAERVDTLVDDMSAEGYEDWEDAAMDHVGETPYEVLVDALSLAFGISEKVAAKELDSLHVVAQQCHAEKMAERAYFCPSEPASDGGQA